MQVVQVYFVYMDRRNSSQEWSLNYANRNKLWHFLTAIIWGLWWFFGKDENLYIFALFYFVFEGDFQVQDPRGAYIRRGDFTEDFLRYEYGGLYLEGLIFGILRYFPENFRCKLTYYESLYFSGSSLSITFSNPKSLGFLFCKKFLAFLKW